MAVDSPQLKLDPYTSTVPLVQIPTQDFQQGQPQPIGAGFMNKKGQAADFGGALLSGIMRGHAFKEAKKYEQAQATIHAVDQTTEASYQQYQDALASGKDPAATEAAYKNYVDTFNHGKEAKTQFVLPDKKAKGSTSSGGQGSKEKKSKAQSFGGGIKDFFEANQHIIPQIALMTMQPKPPGLDREGRLEQAQEQMFATQQKTAEAQLSGLQYNQKQQEQADQRAAAQRQVEASGGVDAVIADKKADPQLQQAAREMKFAKLDAMDPINQMKLQGIQDVQSGASKGWDPQKRMLMGQLGVIPLPQPTTVNGKNGHQQQVLIDPTTNQPIPGSKPLDLGPPAWAQEFYAKQGALHSELRKAVESDPAQYGVKLTGNAEADKAAIGARVAQLQVQSDFGIHTLSDTLGVTGYEIQRNNEMLNDVVKASGLNAKEGASPLDSGSETMDYGDGKTFAVGRDYFAKMLGQFTVESGGVRAFRQDQPVPGVKSPSNPDGKPANVLDAERREVYKWVKNQMMTQKGKKALTSEQADQLLKGTSIGTPIVAQTGGMTKPPQAPTTQRASGGMTPPPQAGGAKKLYSVPGHEGAYELSDEEAAKAKAANIPIVELSSDVLQQFSQQ